MLCAARCRCLLHFHSFSHANNFANYESEIMHTLGVSGVSVSLLFCLASKQTTIAIILSCVIGCIQCVPLVWLVMYSVRQVLWVGLSSSRRWKVRLQVCRELHTWRKLRVWVFTNRYRLSLMKNMSEQSQEAPCHSYSTLYSCSC